MRTYYVPSRLCAYACLVMLCISQSLLGQSLFDQVSYTVQPACFNPNDGKYATEDRFFIKIDINSIEGAEENFGVTMNDVNIVQFHVDKTELPHTQIIGPFPHSGQGGYFIDLTLQSLESGYADDLLVSEVVCGYATSNGQNKPGYFCDGANQGVIAQSAPLEVNNTRAPDQLNIYVLKNDQEIVVDKNYTGLFEGLSDLETYTLHAFAVSTGEYQAFYKEIEVGSELLIDHNLQCYALCGLFDVFVRCEGFDLALSKDIVNGTMFRLGDTVEYSITVTNEGVLTAFDVVVEDYVPEELLFVASLNDAWAPDKKSLPIDSIRPGESVSIPIALIVDGASPNIEIVNSAEIYFASDLDDHDVPAFDSDSTPNNDDKDEDDRDNAVISILENLCEATFELDMSILDPVCDNSPITLAPMIMRATMPVSYEWRFEGSMISTDSMLYIASPGETDYGQYSLTVRDFNTCESTETIQVESITDKRPSCINDINLSVSSDCSLNIYPDMLTLNDIPGINDFILEVRDGNGDLIDLNNLFGVSDEAPLEVRMINPCTGQTVCWANIHLEYKLPPKFEYYQDTIVTNCIEIHSPESPSAAIDDYNELGLTDILSREEYAAEVLNSSCLLGWDIETVDLSMVSDERHCSDEIFARVYNASNGIQTRPLDTAILVVSIIDIDSLHFPADRSNILCENSIKPIDIEATPYYVYRGDTLQLDYSNNNENSQKACNVLITYSDQVIGPGCAFGTSKTLRQWSAVDWCDNSYKTDNQYVFSIDDTPPTFILDADTIEISLEGLACYGDIDLEGMIQLSDNCDPNPTINIDGYAYSGYFIQNVQSGVHHITLSAYDDCDNMTTQTVVVRVTEKEPPIALALGSVAFTYSDSSSNWIYANSFDNGSHDSGCGEVTVQIARMTELEQIEANGTMSTFEMRDPCDEGLSDQDADLDGELTRMEMFRDGLLICCDDIGTTIVVVMRVTDQSGNYKELMTNLRVSSKAEVFLCDDGDPCTYNDQRFGDCPCAGISDDRDMDEDGILDCVDSEFLFCKDNITLSLNRDEIEEAIANGAVAGTCEEADMMAMLAGETYTFKGEMIENVRIQNNYDAQTMTSVEGAYAFPNNPMYEKYELMPDKNDDPLNGVSALDLILIQQHLLGISAIDNPYYMLAADINGDGRISGSDIAELRKLLLGQIDSFQSNNSWRFIPVKDGINESNPYEYDEEIIIQSLSQDEMDIDWIGVKTGDVSGDAVANSLNTSKARSDKSIDIVTSDQVIEKGQEVIIPIYSASPIKLRAMQLGLYITELDIVGVESGVLDISPTDFVIFDDARGFNMLVTPHSLIDANNTRPLFTIIATSKTQSQLSDILDISAGSIQDLIIDDTYSPQITKLSITNDSRALSSVDDYKLYQNLPNPFDDNTTIAFDISEANEVTFEFYNAQGILLYKTRESYPKGKNSISVKTTDLGGIRGLVYYQMEVKGFKSTRSMVVGMN